MLTSNIQKVIFILTKFYKQLTNFATNVRYKSKISVNFKLKLHLNC